MAIQDRLEEWRHIYEKAVGIEQSLKDLPSETQLQLLSRNIVSNTACIQKELAKWAKDEDYRSIVTVGHLQEEVYLLNKNWDDFQDTALAPELQRIEWMPTKGEVVDEAMRLPPRELFLKQIKFYHVTCKDRLDSILKEGLKPTAEPEMGRHLEAVFLSQSEEGAHAAADWLECEPVLLEVEITPDVKVYRDWVSYFTGPWTEPVYIRQSVPPQSIKVLREL